MPGVTQIEWADAVWNPTVGCTRLSAGCDNCYIERSIPFRSKGRKFELVGKQETTGVTLHPERLGWPLSREADRLSENLGRPARVFVNSLSDLFHEDIPAEFVRDAFDVMAKAQHLTFLILTKRPRRALELIGAEDAPIRVGVPWPIPWVWLGVSIEHWRFNWRADVLRRVPAAVRFISAEPLIGTLFPGLTSGESPDAGSIPAGSTRALDLDGIDWLIAGGESGGRKARPMHPAWARELRDACADSGTAFFFKQHGSHEPDGANAGEAVFLGYDGRGTRERMTLDAFPDSLAEPVVRMRYVGVAPKSGGKRLDGREHCEFPEDVTAEQAFAATA